MRYFYDTEFIEDGKTIDLISIGIVADDGREYYGERINAELGQASGWVQENVLPYLQAARFGQFLGREQWHWDWKHPMARTCLAVAEEVRQFCDPEKYGKPEFWGYYSAYDHVALCQLFGTMMNLPKGWPMYTRDIKQWCDALGNPPLPEQGKGEHHALADAKWNRQAWEFLNRLKIEQRRRD